jgi:ABC-type sugar transport system ATPase subunit
MKDVLLEVTGISKRFGATAALQDVNLKIRGGTIHALLGRNGAGKSTLVNIIAGVYRQDQGRVMLTGEEISHTSVFERQKIGIRLVPQHASVIPELSVEENIFLGLWPQTKSGFVDWKSLHTRAVRELKNYGLQVKPSEKVKKLSNVDRRKVNIVRAMYGGAKLVILDEPTTSLTVEERTDLFGFINRLKEQGTAFIFISHYLHEVIELSDEITVIRDGKAFAASGSEGVNEENLTRLIAGENVQLVHRQHQPGVQNNQTNLVSTVLSCEEVYGPCLKGVSFSLHRGEILGVVGLPGSGAQEICRLLFGLEKVYRGRVWMGDREPDISCPTQAMRSGISYLPGDRHKEGIIGLMSIFDNMSTPLLNSKLKTRFGFINKARALENARYYFNLLKVKANTIYENMNSLSGGNQQKVVVGKTLSIDPKVLILDEPTIGIDIKSREEIIAIIDEMAVSKGVGIMYMTNDFDELVRIADRVIFFNGGYLVGDVSNKNLSHEDIIKIRDSFERKM